MNALRLWLGLAHLRYGALHWIAAGLLLAAGLLHGVAVPRLEALLALEQPAARSGQASGRTSGPLPDDSARAAILRRRYDAFTTVVSDEGQIPHMVDTVFANAVRRGLVLAQADYKRSDGHDDGFVTLEMRIPVKGAYPDVRHFVDDTLGAMPGVALKEATFRREVINSETVDAQLRFVFFLKEMRR